MFCRNVAVTVWFAPIVIEIGLVLPDRSPLQWSKCEPVAAVAVSCTEVPQL